MTALTRRRLVATILLALPVLASGSAQAAPLQGRTDQVAVEPGAVRFVISVDELPVGQQLDAASVRVISGGRQWPATAVPVTAGEEPVTRTAVIAVDTSGSMGAAGIDQARVAAERFLEVVPADVSVGLVTFADEALLQVSPTTDRDAVRAALGRMEPRGNTSLYDGLGVALQALGTEGDRSLVLLSDGKDTTSGTSLASASDALAGSGVTAEFVAFRTEDTQVEVLNGLAGRVDGRVTEASNGAQLTDVFAAVANTLVNQVIVTANVPADVPAEPADLVVELGTGSGMAVATTRVDVQPAPVGSLTAAETSGHLLRGIPGMLPVLLVVTFLALFVLLAVALTPATHRGSVSARRTRQLRQYGGEAGDESASAREPVPAVVTAAALAWAQRTLKQRGLEEGWRLDLDRAGLPLRPHEWLILKMSATITGVAVGFLFLPWWLLTAPLAGLAGWLLAGGYLRFRTGRRLRRFNTALPDVLQLIAGSLQSGFSLPQAVDNAAKEGDDPIAPELTRALTEARLGVPLEDALDRVAHRMKSRDLAWTIMAIRIAREVGGNLAEVLTSTAETMRERGRLLRQVKALSAEGKLSAYILIGLPIVLAIFLAAFRGEYMAPLVTDPIGWAMVLYAVVSVAFGSWWMSRMIKLEV
jgi:Flp pilus assembly protein TadB/Mg-chelatase subunit ChlD